MNYIECPFCKNIVYSYWCSNHSPINVMFISDLLNNFDIKYIKLSNSEYKIYINKTNMLIYHYILLVSETALDPSLTPENFEKKLNTYLTFL